ncbi:MAG: hypothetical protein IJU56_06375 [Clostridia bacterium]|nr:hypothetical protein [Clostridia bacterium]
MKHLKTSLALLLVFVLSFTLLASCANVEKDIVGSWRESTGKLGYDFADNGTLKIHYLDFTIPVIGTKLSSDIDGTYTLEKGEDGAYHLKVSYTLLANINEEYTVTVDHDILTMTNTTTGNTYTLTRAAQAAAPASTTAASTTSAEAVSE